MLEGKPVTVVTTLSGLMTPAGAFVCFQAQLLKIDQNTQIDEADISRNNW